MTGNNFFFNLFSLGDFQVLQITDYWKTVPERMTCHIEWDILLIQGVKHLCPCMSLLWLHQKFPADAGSLTGLPGALGKRVRDFRTAANRSRRVMRKCQTCIQPITKGAPPCAGVTQWRERGRGGGRKERDFDLVRIYKRV